MLNWVYKPIIAFSADFVGVALQFSLEWSYCSFDKKKVIVRLENKTLQVKLFRIKKNPPLAKRKRESVVKSFHR